MEEMVREYGEEEMTRMMKEIMENNMMMLKLQKQKMRQRRRHKEREQERREYEEK